MKKTNWKKLWKYLHSWHKDIPCKNCRNLVRRYFLFFHDVVNLKLGKPIFDKENFNYMKRFIEKGQYHYQVCNHGRWVEKWHQLSRWMVRFPCGRCKQFLVESNYFLYDMMFYRMGKEELPYCHQKIFKRFQFRLNSIYLLKEQNNILIRPYEFVEFKIPEIATKLMKLKNKIRMKFGLLPATNWKATLEYGTWIGQGYNPDYTQACNACSPLTCNAAGNPCADPTLDCDNFLLSACASGCPAPKPNSSLVSNTCSCSYNNNSCLTCPGVPAKCRQNGTCTLSGTCGYNCNAGFIFDGTNCVAAGGARVFLTTNSKYQGPL